MKLTKENLLLFGFTREEGDIFSALEETLSLQEISKKLPIPRTTIAYTLKNLLKRGFVFKVPVGKRYKFCSLSTEQFKDKLEKAFEGKTKGAAIAPTKKILYFHGLENVMKAENDFIRVHRDERIYAIQPSQSWQALHLKAGDEHVLRTNKIIKDNRLIIDAVLEEGAYQMFKKINQHKKDFADLAKSFSGRMADYIFAPNGYLTDRVEMWIIKDGVMFIDWIEEVGIQIYDKHIVGFLKDMFKLVKLTGKKIDHNQAIEMLIDK